ncbi:hypothetical protein DOT_0828 [Desulfosporosinus sp. OT]|nr:hypothetical protein DOT_0828 [Desulfosporosinus sp. OT]
MVPNLSSATCSDSININQTIKKEGEVVLDFVNKPVATSGC